MTSLANKTAAVNFRITQSEADVLAAVASLNGTHANAYCRQIIQSAIAAVMQNTEAAALVNQVIDSKKPLAATKGFSK